MKKSKQEFFTLQTPCQPERTGAVCPQAGGQSTCRQVQKSHWELQKSPDCLNRVGNKILSSVHCHFCPGQFVSWLGFLQLFCWTTFFFFFFLSNTSFCEFQVISLTIVGFSFLHGMVPTVLSTSVHLYVHTYCCSALIGSKEKKGHQKTALYANVKWQPGAFFVAQSKARINKQAGGLICSQRQFNCQPLRVDFSTPRYLY